MVPHAGNLDVKGVDRQQRAPLRCRREQRGRIAGKIVAAHQAGAKFGSLPVLARVAHGTAISAAATRRRSPIMML
jgi:hypothetical protein